MFNSLHRNMNQEIFWKNLYNLCIPKEMMLRPNFINYRLESEVSIMLGCWLCSTRYTAIRIKNCLKNAFAIKVAVMKNMDDFRFEGKPSRSHAKSTPLSTPFLVSKDEWDTKEDTGKSMKNALYVLRYAKRHLLGRSDVEQ